MNKPNDTHMPQICANVKAMIKSSQANQFPDLNEKYPPYDYTLLHYAAEYNDVDMAKFLVANGADTSASDRFNNTPLHYAAIFGQYEVAEYLLECGIDRSLLSVEVRTASQKAIIYNHNDIADLIDKYEPFQTKGVMDDRADKIDKIDKLVNLDSLGKKLNCLSIDE